MFSETWSSREDYEGRVGARDSIASESFSSTVRPRVAVPRPRNPLRARRHARSRTDPGLAPLRPRGPARPSRACGTWRRREALASRGGCNRSGRPGSRRRLRSHHGELPAHRADGRRRRGARARGRWRRRARPRRADPRASCSDALGRSARTRRRANPAWTSPDRPPGGRARDPRPALRLARSEPGDPDRQGPRSTESEPWRRTRTMR